jgi:AcrR family transcriptional regulator
MNADERRELVLRAATRAFSRAGFHGTSTDAVAKEAGVSQPYVVRIFGTKLDLFLEVFARSAQQIRGAFEEVLAGARAEGLPLVDEEVWGRLGLSYARLLADRDFLQVLMHGFSAGSVPEIGARARAGMGQIYATLMTTGCEPERAKDFIAQGMLLNVMMTMQAPEHADEGDDLAALTVCAFGDALAECGSPGVGAAV